VHVMVMMVPYSLESSRGRLKIIIAGRLFACSNMTFLFGRGRSRRFLGGCLGHSSATLLGSLGFRSSLLRGIVNVHNVKVAVVGRLGLGLGCLLGGRF